MSANRRYPHYPIIPESHLDVGNMIMAGVKVDAICNELDCQHRWIIDLPKIRDARGGFYSLCGRKARCPKCKTLTSTILAMGGHRDRFHLSNDDPMWGAELRHRCGWCGGAPNVRPKF